VHGSGAFCRKIKEYREKERKERLKKEKK